MIHNAVTVSLVLCLVLRYSSANVEGSLSRQHKYDSDDFSCSVAPQYWTWGNRMKGIGGGVTTQSGVIT